MKVMLYVEGGGNSSADRACREAFHHLFVRAGLAGRLPQARPYGMRNRAYSNFKQRLRVAEPDEYPMLLVDSEAPVEELGKPWEHLKARDGWVRPPGAEDDQAQLMVQCMETWLLADQAAMRSFFRKKLQLKALPPTEALEARAKDDVQSALAKATRPCGPDKEYKKGKRSFELLASLNAAALREKLPHFDRLCKTLESKLAQ